MNLDQNYHRDKLTAKAGDEEARVALAARTDVQPEILYYLTDDESPRVRRELAANDMTPRQADVLLASDEEEAVRADLADKVVRLVPDLDANAQDKVQQMTIKVLETLARDQAVRVRRILAETLREVVAAPPQVINRLARDTEIVVARPVLTFSPVLTYEDLLDVIASSPVAGALGAIAKRHEVGEVVADAIVDAGDDEAIGLLLANKSAQIREETLDAIIDRAEPVEAWHLPIIQRPALPTKAAVRLARFVAENLVGALLGRGDILAGDIPEIRRVVEKRIADGDFSGESLADHWGKNGTPKANELVDIDDLQPGDEETVDGRPAAERVADLAKQGKLDDQALKSAFDDGDVTFAVCAVAHKSDMPVDLVRKAADCGRPEAIIALCHAAGIPADMLVAAQRAMGGIALANTLKPTDGGYPLDASAMAQAIEDVRNAPDDVEGGNPID